MTTGGSDDRPRRRRRVLVVGVEKTPETFLAQLFTGLAHHHDLRVVSRLGGSRPRAVRSRLGAAVGLTPEPMPDPVARAMVEVRRWRPDVVYFPWNSAAISGALLYEQGIPVVVSCRGSQVGVARWDPDRAERTDVLANSLRRATRVHCVSDELAGQARELGVDAASIDVVRPAVDPDRFAPPAARRDATAGRLHVVTTGSLIWRKAVEDLVIAVAGARARGAEVDLTVIGDGPERDRVRLAAVDLGVADHVTLTGRLTPAEVRAVLDRATAFALPSVFEGISNAVLEAMACGLPSVAARVGGMAEAIDDDVDGVLVDPRRPDELAEALHALAVDPDRRARLGAAGRERVLARHRLEDQVRAYAALFDRAAGGSS